MQLLRSVLSILFRLCEMGNTSVCGCTQVLEDFFPFLHHVKTWSGRVWQEPVIQSPKKAVAQDHIKTGFEYIQRWRLHNLSGQPVQVFSHPYSKRVFPDVQMTFLVFLLFSIASGPFPRHHKRAWVHLLF